MSHPIGGYLGELPIGGGAFTFTPHEGPIKQVKGKTASPPPSNDQASSPKGEEEELREAVRINEVPVYLDFIFNYPDSPHINFVQERIRTLQKGARPESKNPLSSLQIMPYGSAGLCWSSLRFFWEFRSWVGYPA